jgi:hypothetical protein
MTTDITRLHISPLTPALLDTVLTPPLRAITTEISFHTIQTFPEKSYGYISLPVMEAEKLKQKLNGSILKGEKLKVQVARPQGRRNVEETDATLETKSNPERVSKKRKAEDGVIAGYELPMDRQVKRGWTATPSAKKEERQRKANKNKDKNEKRSKGQAKSKYTENAECLFRTKTPPNRPVDSIDNKKHQRPKKSKSKNEVLVHEFSKSVTHPSFVRSGEEVKRFTTRFAEGQGWIDDMGNVKEPASETIAKRTYQPGQRDGGMKTHKSLDKKLAKKNNDTPITKEEPPDEVGGESESDWTSSSSISDDTSSVGSEFQESVSSDTSDDEDLLESSLDGTKEDKETLRPESDATAAIASANIESHPTASRVEMHPLEALFKRPGLSEKNKPTLEINTQFTFFGGNGEEDQDGRGTAIDPQTPFSKRDFQIRGMRSAAPTPDTALPSRAMFWPSEDENDDEEAEDTSIENEAPKPHTRSTSQKPAESEFTKWFWDHRGENNRAWKRRRREVAKEKRQRDNRRKGMKGRS